MVNPNKVNASLMEGKKYLNRAFQKMKWANPKVDFLIISVVVYNPDLAFPNLVTQSENMGERLAKSTLVILTQ